MQFIRNRWPDLPIATAGALLFIGGMLLWAQVILGAVAHGRQMKLCAALYHVPRPPTSAFTVADVLGGAWQSALAKGIGYREPYFPLAVHLRDQIEFSLFKVSATPPVVVGTGDELLGQGYIDDYCTRNIASFMVTAPAWAAKIKQMQDGAQARNQTFLYIITTSKVAQYPGYLPAGLVCPSALPDRTGLVPAWVKLLRTFGVNTLDLTTIIAAARANYPVSLYPQAGIHWDALGSAIASQAVETKLQTLRHDNSFTPFTFTWSMSNHPAGTDLDMALLLNLLWPDNKFVVPAVASHQAPKAAGCHYAKITIVGGSFMQRIGPELSKLPCGIQIVEYFYWSRLRNVWTDGVDKQEPINQQTRDNDLLHADIIIYEENESLLGRSEHGEKFYQWIMQHRQANP